MKICFYLGGLSHPGGIERVTTTLVNNLANQHDISVDIVCFNAIKDKPVMPVSEKVNVFSIQDTEATHSTPHSYKRVFQKLRGLKAVRNFFKTHEYDVIIAQAFPLVFTLWAAHIDMSKVFCCEHVHYNYYKGFIKSLRHLVYRKSGRIVTLTQQDKQAFENRHSNVICIPNPIPIPEEANEYSLGSKTIIAAGRLCEQKGFDLLIDAYKKIAGQFPAWKLEIWGQGHLKDNLQKQIEESNMEKYISLMGSTDDMPSKYKNASFFVLSSRFEGFSMVLAEALSYNLPVVSFNCPTGPSDFVTNEFNGLMIENGDVDALSQAIKRMIESPELRSRMSSVGKESVEQFSTDNIISKWQTELKRFLNEK